MDMKEDLPPQSLIPPGMQPPGQMGPMGPLGPEGAPIPEMIGGMGQRRKPTFAPDEMGMEPGF